MGFQQGRPVVPATPGAVMPVAGGSGLGRQRLGPRGRGMAWLPLAALVVLGAGCAAGPPPVKTEIDATRAPNVTVTVPSREQAAATGRACSGSEADALKAARRIATYNLRAVTGATQFGVDFAVVGKETPGEEVCLTVAATVRAARRR